MSEDAKKLAQALLDYYFDGRPHDRGCDCRLCRLWDACEHLTEQAFTDLKKEIEQT